MRGAFDLLVLPNSMFKPFFILKDYVLSGEIDLKITIIIIIFGRLTHFISIIALPHVS